MFSSRQLGFIAHNAEILYQEGMRNSLLDDITVGSADIMDDIRYDSLPSSWKPSEPQIIAIYAICEGFDAFWEDMLNDAETTSDDLVTFSDVRELVVSIRRSLIRQVK